VTPDSSDHLDAEGVPDSDRFVPYSDLFETALGEAARKAFHMIPKGYEFQSETVRNAIQKGRVTEKAATILEVLEARGLSATGAERERIRGTTDLEMLTRWLSRAATVASVDALFE
jgi:hypothetical protein